MKWRKSHARFYNISINTCSCLSAIFEPMVTNWRNVNFCLNCIWRCGAFGDAVRDVTCLSQWRQRYLFQRFYNSLERVKSKTIESRKKEKETSSIESWLTYQIKAWCPIYPVVDRVDRSSRSNLGQVESIEKSSTRSTFKSSRSSFTASRVDRFYIDLTRLYIDLTETHKIFGSFRSTEWSSTYFAVMLLKLLRLYLYLKMVMWNVYLTTDLYFGFTYSLKGNRENCIY